jgi:hypothetical protein
MTRRELPKGQKINAPDDPQLLECKLVRVINGVSYSTKILSAGLQSRKLGI